jgi:hypothetical protein
MLNWQDFYVNPETGQEMKKDDEGAELIRIGLKFLQSGEVNDIQNDVYNMQAKVKGRKSGTVESRFNIGLYHERKMLSSIKSWENVTDEETDELLPVTLENIRCLPAWMGAELINTIDEMNNLNVEIEEE